MFEVERIYHPWDKWECYKAGFYEEKTLDENKEKEFKKCQEFIIKIRMFMKLYRRE